MATAKHTRRKEMKINKLVYRDTQKSILCDERSELLALFSVEHDGHQGHLLYEATFDKRDTDSQCYCDIESVTKDTIAYDGAVVDALNIDVWKMKPEYTKDTATDDEVWQLIGKLWVRPI